MGEAKRILVDTLIGPEFQPYGDLRSARFSIKQKPASPATLTNEDPQFTLEQVRQHSEEGYEVRLPRTIRPNQHTQSLRLKHPVLDRLESVNLDLQQFHSTLPN